MIFSKITLITVNFLLIIRKERCSSSSISSSSFMKYTNLFKLNPDPNYNEHRTSKTPIESDKNRNFYNSTATIENGIIPSSFVRITTDFINGNEKALNEFKDRTISTAKVEVTKTIVENITIFVKKLDKKYLFPSKYTIQNKNLIKVTKKAAELSKQQKRVIFNTPKSILSSRSSTSQVTRHLMDKTQLFIAPSSNLKKITKPGTKKLMRKVTHISKEGTHKLMTCSSKGTRAKISRITCNRIFCWYNIERAMILSFPIFGGLFAVIACQADLNRSLKELSQMKVPNIAFYSFFFAAVADYIDILAQCFIGHLVFKNSNTESNIWYAESLSTFCAVASTIAAVSGELLSKSHDDTQSKVNDEKIT